MSEYVRIYNLTLKDSLPSGNSGKVIKGTELDAELNAVAAAIGSKSDSNSPTFTGTPAAPTATLGTNTTQLATTAFVQAALQAVYPVGSIYINATSSSNPSTLLGFGTWEAFGTGRVMVGLDAGDPTFDVLGETVGSKDAIVVSHSHTGSTNSAGSHMHGVTDPGHTHGTGGSAQSANNGPDFPAIRYNSSPQTGTVTTSAATGISINSSGSHTHSVTTDATGSSGTNANIQPSIVVRMWKRTA